MQAWEFWKNVSESWKSPGNLFLKKGTNPDFNIRKVYSIDLARRPLETPELMRVRPPRMTINLQISAACVQVGQIRIVRLGQIRIVRLGQIRTVLLKTLTFFS